MNAQLLSCAAESEFWREALSLKDGTERIYIYITVRVWARSKKECACVCACVYIYTSVNHFCFSKHGEAVLSHDFNALMGTSHH